MASEMHPGDSLARSAATGDYIPEPELLNLTSVLINVGAAPFRGPVGHQQWVGRMRHFPT